MISSSGSCETIGMWLLLFVASYGIVFGSISSHSFGFVVGDILITTLVPASMLLTLRGGWIRVFTGFTLGVGLSFIAAGSTLGVYWFGFGVVVTFGFVDSCSKLLSSSAIVSSLVWPMGANSAVGVGLVIALERLVDEFSARSDVYRKSIFTWDSKNSTVSKILSPWVLMAYTLQYL